MSEEVVNYAKEYDSAMKKNEILKSATMSMDLKGIVLIETDQTKTKERQISDDFTYCGT